MLSVTDASRRNALVAPERKRYARIPEVLPIPDLIELQLQSFRWFIDHGLRELLDEISPIQDFTGKVMELHFKDYEFGEPKWSELECRTRDLTFSKPLYVDVELRIKETGEIQSQRVYMGDFPTMTDQGTFIINGAERVVVSQLVRSPGVYYTATEDPATGRPLYSAKVIPNRGAWLEFETGARHQLYVKVDRKRKLEATKLLRAVGWESNDQMVGVFSRVDTGEVAYIPATLEKDSTSTRQEALIEVYKKLRPGDPPTGDNAEKLVESLFFNFRRYDLGRVGRYKVNKKLDLVAARMGIDLPRDERTITKEDIAAIVGQLIELNNGIGKADDIDHLGNRRIRANGELIQNAFRVGLLRMERVVKERMTIQEIDKATPNALINIRPVVAAMKEFFGGSQLSQFMDQTNPLAELTSKRRLSALGPGGLSRERAGFDVRDVHHSHYGRICPIETPEGPNIGLIGSLATYGRINQYGFIETPYRKVKRSVAWDDPEIEREVADADVATKSGTVVLKKGAKFTKEAVAELKKQTASAFHIRPRVTEEIQYLAAYDEEESYVAQANAKLDDEGHFVDERVPSRHADQFPEARPQQIEFMDVSPKQVVSVATALIPFLEHDDANRALMGSNMQRQAVPLLEPEAPIVGTGMEARAAQDSGQVLIARRPGTVLSVTAGEILVEPDEGKAGELDTYRLDKFVRSNQGTCINQRPVVDVGMRVTAGDVLADSSSTDKGELALGRNILVAFMSWEGGNYEDAIVISDRMVREDLFTSIHIEKHELESRDTKLGPEEITRDIPNVGEESLKDLDEDGIVYIGAEVQPGDILVGKITPKGETELTAEERLLRAISGRQPTDPRQRRGQAQDLGRRQDGRPPWQQGGGRQDPAPGGHAVPAGRHSCRHHPQSAGRAEPHEHRPDPRNAPRLGTARAGPPERCSGQGGNGRLRRGHRTADPRGARHGRSPALGQDGPARWPDGRVVRPGDHRRLHLHAQAPSPGGGQDPCPLHRALQPHHPAAARRQGPVRRAAFRRDGGLGPGGLRGREHPAGAADRQVGRRHGSRPDVRGHRQGRGHPGARGAGVLQGAHQGAAEPGAQRGDPQRERGGDPFRRGRIGVPVAGSRRDQSRRFRGLNRFHAGRLSEGTELLPIDTGPLDRRRGLLSPRPLRSCRQAA
jgi:DNA-directed RNA polymerase subunit beta